MNTSEKLVDVKVGTNGVWVVTFVGEKWCDRCWSQVCLSKCCEEDWAYETVVRKPNAMLDAGEFTCSSDEAEDQMDDDWDDVSSDAGQGRRVVDSRELAALSQLELSDVVRRPRW